METRVLASNAVITRKAADERIEGALHAVHVGTRRGRHAADGVPASAEPQLLLLLLS